MTNFNDLQFYKLSALGSSVPACSPEILLNLQCCLDQVASLNSIVTHPTLL